MDYHAVSLQKESPIPLYRQLADHIQQALARGDLHPGEQLPPIRKLAHLLGISPITVSQTYEELALLGVASSHIGRGTFLLPCAPSPPDDLVPQERASHSASMRSHLQEYLWMNALTQQVKPPRVMRLQQMLLRVSQRWHEPSPLIPMSSGNPDVSLFSLDRWHQAMNQAGLSLQEEQAQTGKSDLLQYGTSALGDPSLRRFLATYVQRYNIHVDEEQILLTSGTQQGLDLVARSFLQSGTTVFIDEFSYISALDIFEQHGVQLQPVPLDEHGMRIDLLEELLVAPQPYPRLLYCIPTGHSPTGVYLPENRRARLRDLAHRYNLLLIEDDAFNDLYYQGKSPVPALWNREMQGRVIYLKSFSKTIFPGTRLGCLIADPALLSVVMQHKLISDRATSIPLARAVLRYIDTSAYERELLHARSSYRHHRDVLLAALERDLRPFGCHWLTPMAGFNLLLTLPSHFDEMQVVEEAAAHGLAIAPGHFFTSTLSHPLDPTLRITFADKPPELLDDAIRRLASVLITLEQATPRSSQRLTHFTTEV
jgi:DNA-binding transcriptional MocR family regulator